MQSDLGRNIEYIRCMFAYISSYAPDFPMEDKTNMQTMYGKLIAHLENARLRVRAEERRNLLAICVKELRESLGSFENGDEKHSNSLYNDAMRHFEEAFSQSRLKRASFIAGPDGISHTPE